jgi:hypothetical protein
LLLGMLDPTNALTEPVPSAGELGLGLPGRDKNEGNSKATEAEPSPNADIVALPPDVYGPQRPPPPPRDQVASSEVAIGQLASIAPPPLASSQTTTTLASSAEAALIPSVLAEPEEDDWLLRTPSWLVSMVVHLLLMLLLAMITTESRPEDEPIGLVASEVDSGFAADVSKLQPEQVQVIDSQLEEAAKLADELAVKGDAAEMLLPRGDVLAPSADLAAFGAAPNPVLPTGGMGLDGLLIGNSLETRLDAEARGRLLAEGGGTPESEAAVERALVWLAKHQNYDGSWNFDLRKCTKCRGRCKGNGSHSDARIAATGMALLPFLGKGHTHKSGEYQKTVHAGLHFLVRSIHVDENTAGSLWQSQGQMYGHGLASIALCEAYGMTRDKTLRAPAQAVIDYIVAAQDPRGGGWRYGFQNPGDTSVVGWQLMALKSAEMAYLNVPTETIRKTEYFLNSVQDDRGAMYGYTSSGSGHATTAIGLLCRLYIGKRSSENAIMRGARHLSKWGPALEKTGPRVNDLYYNYYATQVLHHLGGSPWVEWNKLMRNHLIASQALDEESHEYGSWYFNGNDHGHSAGGRLYCTAMAAMILEVYYRHMPLYRQKPGKGFFR